MPPAPSVPPADARLVRAIGIRQLTASIINTTIGAGIFVLPAVVAAGLGPAAPRGIRQRPRPASEQIELANDIGVCPVYSGRPKRTSCAAQPGRNPPP